jgi:hypothetical protein
MIGSSLYDEKEGGGQLYDYILKVIQAANKIQ